MSKLKRIFAAAAVLVVGGLGLTQAIRQANQAEQRPLTCAEFGRILDRIEGDTLTWYVAVAQGYTPPLAVGDRLLGACAGGRCVVDTPCPRDVGYTFEASPAAGGWRLVRMTGHRYFAGGWRLLAAAAPEVKVWGSQAEVQTACLGVLTAGECLSLMRPLGDCWRQADGDLCRYGVIYGPGTGGDVACSVGAGDTWYPCSDQGHGLAWGERSRTEAMPPDEELDLP